MLVFVQIEYNCVLYFRMGTHYIPLAKSYNYYVDIARIV